MRSRLLTRIVCALLAATVVVPPTAPRALAQERTGIPAAPEVTLDLRGLDALDADPVTGAVLYAREDLSLGLIALSLAGASVLAETHDDMRGPTTEAGRIGCVWANELFDANLLSQTLERIAGCAAQDREGRAS